MWPTEDAAFRLRNGLHVHFIFLGNGERIWSRFRITAALRRAAVRILNWDSLRRVAVTQSHFKCALRSLHTQHWDSLRRAVVTHSHFKYALRSAYPKLWDTALVFSFYVIINRQSSVPILKNASTENAWKCPDVFLISRMHQVQTWENPAVRNPRRRCGRPVYGSL